MKNKLFNKNIDCNCEYCDNFTDVNGEYICKLNREINENGKCRKFIYNPLKRVPKRKPKLPEYDPNEFVLW